MSAVIEVVLVAVDGLPSLVLLACALVQIKDLAVDGLPAGQHLAFFGCIIFGVAGIHEVADLAVHRLPALRSRSVCVQVILGTANGDKAAARFLLAVCVVEPLAAFRYPAVLGFLCLLGFLFDQGLFHDSSFLGRTLCGLLDCSNLIGHAFRCALVRCPLLSFLGLFAFGCICVLFHCFSVFFLLFDCLCCILFLLSRLRCFLSRSGLFLSGLFLHFCHDLRICGIRLCGGNTGDRERCECKR